MLIGGYALPFYGRIRATIDIDIAVAIKTENEFKKLNKWLQSINFKIPVYSFANPVIIILDDKEKMEIELWLKPDGIVFDKETLKRRRRAKLDKDTEAWIISPEDFIVNKLARPDRGVDDEKDVKSVLTRQGNKIDVKYLKKRAQNAGILVVLENIQKM